MRGTASEFVVVRAAVGSCAVQQVGAEILPLALAKPQALSLACGTEGHSYLIFSTTA